MKRDLMGLEAISVAATIALLGLHATRGSTAAEGPRVYVSYCKLETCTSVLFCSLAVLDPRVGHTMDVPSPFISALCHSD